jgi:hypothetical protein
MFLTTNRVRNSDKAFRSRIHMAVQYSHLLSESRQELWTTFISKACRGSIPGWLHDGTTTGQPYLERLAGEELNGRQIKNTVLLANALAYSDKTDVQPSHIEKVPNYTRTFSVALEVDSQAKSRGKLPTATQEKRKLTKRSDKNRKRR